MTEVGSANLTFIPPSLEDFKKAVDLAMFAAKEQMLTDCNYYCKQDTGTLISKSRAEEYNCEVALTWDTDYAIYAYYTGRPSKDKNPNASLQWAEKAQDSFGKDWVEIISKGIK